MLIFGELPTAAQLEKFENDIRKYTLVNEEMKNIIDGFPKTAHPMGVLSSLTSALTAFNPKVVNVENEKEILDDNKDYELKIEETKDTKKIAGLKCHKIKVTKVNEPNVTFDAWYTKDLGNEDCNALTPYAQVKGMLLDYRVKKMGLEMHFCAKKINNIAIDESTFEVPKNMKIVSATEMRKFFDNLQ